MDSLLAELPGKPGKAIKLFLVLLHPKLCLQDGIQHQYPCIGSNQSILKEISPDYSLEGLMLKLKGQYFGHLMQRMDSLEKTLMLGKIEGRRRKERQRIRWMDAITDLMDMSLSKLSALVKDREAWHAAVHGVSKSQTWLSDWTDWPVEFLVSLSLWPHSVIPDVSCNFQDLWVINLSLSEFPDGYC